MHISIEKLRTTKSCLIKSSLKNKLKRIAANNHNMKVLFLRLHIFSLARCCFSFLSLERAFLLFFLKKTWKHSNPLSLVPGNAVFAQSACHYFFFLFFLVSRFQFWKTRSETKTLCKLHKRAETAKENFCLKQGCLAATLTKKRRRKAE